MNKAYFRRLIVRAIEDVVLVGLVFLGIAFVCAVCSLGLRLLGVE